MADKDKIYAQTVTPGKEGINISRSKYETIFNAIMEILSEQREIRFKDLPRAVANKLENDFRGSIPWYTTTIKLHMEHQGIIERVPKKSPQYLRLIQKK
ncbi:MAG: hypothetical protein GWO41_09220 [candidate division Zixibacteria bacterium]|jgi:hypothetical protein|nr:hypothetical protein [candidate division Zixibacteria bacterium]NIR67559.1 hypothetical protein [candidate division Zixibacteria bacterium]NIS16529.1 hypothetical protein [candidate division Zixibacteria bacterium]NIS48819.1 hypothetical protein [candidate division Zixibacteria bacterium]NIT52898.1 hypothetical protein [candidate division Zixibacteria bacterium]